MKKSSSEYKQAIETLREKHSDKIETIFLEMYGIVSGTGNDDKDRVNAAKVCASLLGISRPATEKAPDKPPVPISRKNMQVPELPPELEERLKNI
jgi:hypothetical protein